MIFIFCGSYLNVVDTITVIEKEGDDFRILCSDPPSARLFSELYSPENVVLLPNAEIVFSRPFGIVSTLQKIERGKRETLSLLRDLCAAKIFFFFTGFGGFESWLIKKLAAQSDVFYKPEISPANFKPTYNVKIWAKGLFYGAIYGIFFYAKRAGAYDFNCLPQSFFRMIRARPIPYSADISVGERLMCRKFPEIPKLRILVLLGGEQDIDKEKYREEMSVLLDQLAVALPPNEIGIKVHPHYNVSGIKIPKGCVILPQYLSATLLLFQCQVVISYFSGTLHQAANAGKKAISLIRMVNAISEKHAEEFKECLLSNTTKEIYFPANISELLKIVESAPVFCREKKGD